MRHPFSSYCQKVLIALYENDTPFELQLLGPGAERLAAEHAALWPFQRIPVLVDAGRTVVESTIIIEYLGLEHPGPVRLVPEEPRAALEVRMMDRFFDNYVMTPMQKFVFDSLRAEEDRDPQGVAEARAILDTGVSLVERRIGRSGVGGGRGLQPGRLCRSSRAVLRRLGSPDRRGVRGRARLPAAVARAAVLRASGRRSAAIPFIFPIGRP